MAVRGTSVAPSDESSIAECYRPPFVLTSDVLFLFTFAPSVDLRRSFPRVPFLSILGRTPLVIWFSRITEACYRTPAGEWRCEHGSPSEALYDEMNVLALLRRRATFVPAIYASELRTVHLGRHYYGMPKQLARAAVHVDGARFEGTLVDGANRSFVRARLLGGGRGLARLASRVRPRWIWPVLFPDGSSVQPLILAARRVQLARVGAGQLAVHAAWLAHAQPLLPFGVYVAGLRIELPAPP